MRHSVFTKTFYDKRGFLIGWSLGFIFLTLLMVLFFPAMQQQGALDGLIDKMPPAFKGLVGNLLDLQHFSTYLASQLFDIRGSIFAGVLAIILGIGITAADEDKGYMRTMLVLPLSRTKVFVQKWLAMVTIMAIIAGVMVTAIYVLAPIVGETASGAWLWQLGLMQWLVMVAFGSITFALGIGTGKRSIAMTAGVLVVAGSFILSTFATSVDWLKDYEVISVLHYFPAVDIAKNGLSVTDVSVLAATAIIPVIVAWLLFRRRDIA